ncbi:MAG: hypothetical protein JJV97_02040 [SAR324 cluster bacterium]|nr:hypothetical protein [SAR324 cluster bacterium]
MKKEIHIFFVGGAGDKERFAIIKKFPILGWGPTNIVGDYVNHFQQKLAALKLNNHYQVNYFSYLEKKSLLLKLAALNKQNTTKQIFVAIVGHSYGASLAYRASKESQQIIDLLITIDPVGAGRSSFLKNWLLSSNMITKKSNINQWEMVWPSSLIFLKSNFVALVGGAWRNHKKLTKFAAKNCSTMIKAGDKSIYHDNFYGLMRYPQKGLSMEDILLNKIVAFSK